MAGALTLTRVCCYRMWGQVALQHALGIPAAIEILVRPDTPADLRRACAFLLANAVKKNEHATWTFVQAGEGWTNVLNSSKQCGAADPEPWQTQRRIL